MFDLRLVLTVPTSSRRATRRWAKRHSVRSTRPCKTARGRGGSWKRSRRSRSVCSPMSARHNCLFGNAAARNAGKVSRHGGRELWRCLCRVHGPATFASRRTPSRAIHRRPGDRLRRRAVLSPFQTRRATSLCSYRQVHDLWHVLLGCSTDMSGEVAVKTVEGIQVRDRKTQGARTARCADGTAKRHLRGSAVPSGDQRTAESVVLYTDVALGRENRIQCHRSHVHLLRTSLRSVTSTRLTPFTLLMQESLVSLRRRWNITKAPRAAS